MCPFVSPLCHIHGVLGHVTYVVLSFIVDSQLSSIDIETSLVSGLGVGRR